jgi:RND family efflux transporter MFP subunit
MMRCIASAVAGLLLAADPLAAAEFVVAPVDAVVWKAVQGTVAARDVVPARGRIGGTVTELAVTEGSRVRAGDTVARIVDDKLALQARAIEARIRALAAERDNARAELERALALLGRGVVTQQRVDQLRTQVDVLAAQIAAAEAERAVIDQQIADGEVRAPVDGRVLRVPVTRGAVALPGETIATIAGGGTFLRLALPERHARLFREGASVDLAAPDSAGEPVPTGRRGQLAKLYPQLEQGRVIADVEVEGLSDYYVGERVLVRVPVGSERVIAVPPAAIRHESGLDFVSVAQGGTVTVVVGGAVETPEGRRVRILSGLRAGDRVVVP